MLPRRESSAAFRNSEQDQESFTLADDSSGYPEELRGRNTDGTYDPSKAVME